MEYPLLAALFALPVGCSYNFAGAFFQIHNAFLTLKVLTLHNILINSKTYISRLQNDMLILFLPLMERETQLSIYSNNIRSNSLQNYQFGKSPSLVGVLFRKFCMKYFSITSTKNEKLVLQDFLSDTSIRL